MTTKVNNTVSQIQCTGKLAHCVTDDDRDIYICNKCGQQGRFDFDLKCKKLITINTNKDDKGQ